MLTYCSIIADIVPRQVSLLRVVEQVAAPRRLLARHGGGHDAIAPDGTEHNDEPAIRLVDHLDEIKSGVLGVTDQDRATRGDRHPKTESRS
jgi:hypothetical protein